MIVKYLFQVGQVILQISVFVPGVSVPKLDTPIRLTIGFLNSLGLTHLTKNGWHAESVRISRSSDCLNCAPSVGVRFRVSVPMATSSLKSPLRYLNLDRWMTWIRSALNVSRFFSRKPRNKEYCDQEQLPRRLYMPVTRTALMIKIWITILLILHQLSP